MKIKFKNLGTIKETELDLRPLTVIIGPNNSNKTYIAYSVYGLFEEVTQPKFNSSSIRELSLISKKIKPLTWKIEVNDFFFKILFEHIKDIETRMKGKYLGLFFQDSSQKIFTDTILKVIVKRKQIKSIISDIQFPKKYAQSKHTLRKLDRTIVEAAYIEASIDYKNDSFWFTFNIENDLDCDIEYDVQSVENHINSIFQFATISLLRTIYQELFSTKYYSFPAERNALVNIYKILSERRYNLLKDAQRDLFLEDKEDRINKQIDFIKQQGNIRYPKPVEDFLDFLSDIELNANYEIDLSKQNEFHKLADLIEQQIQDNHKTLLKPTVLGGREIKISISDDLEIDLYNASSSIKQLAPLLLYLRYRASKGDFIIIDEPEMNLHPESQAKFLEALAILVNLGVKVLLTTHSPYFMSHLNNLVSGDQDHEDRLDKQANFLYLQDKRAFLPMDKVSAYEMRDNQLVSLKDPDYGIRWDTLSDVSGDIQQKHFEIYEAGEEEENDSEE